MTYNLDTLESLERAATPAPWHENEYMDIHSEDALLFEWDTSNENDSELVAALRNAAPKLFADLRRMRRGLESIPFATDIDEAIAVAHRALLPADAQEEA